MLTHFGALLVYLFATANSQETEIPSPYLPAIPWSAVPAFSTDGWTVVDVADRGILPEDTSALDLLQTLIDSLTEPTVLQFHEGTYRLTDRLVFDSSRSSIVLQGSGPSLDSTVFEISSDGFARIRGAGCEYDTSQYNPIPIATDVAVGSREITLSDASGFSVGDVILCEADLDDGEYTYSPRAYGGLFLVEGISDNTLTLNIGLDRGIDSVTSRTATCTVTSPVRNVGFQQFEIRYSGTTRGQNTFEIWLCYDCFVSNVISINSPHHHVGLVQSTHVLVTGSYFYEAVDKGDGGWGYGVSIGLLSTRVEVSNNIFRDVRHHMLFQDGANNCVAAYNAGYDTVRDYCHQTADSNCGELSWLEDPGQNGMTFVCDTPDMIAHGNWPHMNLYEGNVHYIGAVDVAHAHNGKTMFFRNKAKGQPLIWSRSDRGMGYAHYGANDYQAFCANVLMRDTTIGHLDYLERDPVGTLIGGNVISGSPDWGDFSDTVDFPPSLYLSERPVFWLDTGLDWPPFGPNIPNTEDNQIPAELRYHDLPIGPSEATRAVVIGVAVGLGVAAAVVLVVIVVVVPILAVVLGKYDGQIEKEKGK